MSEDNKKVRVRFAPSPTGRLHIGGARTAIFNWAFAHATGGDFILRIEDTDPERSTEENVRVIIDAMKWMGLNWDEGPEVEGQAGPYFQTQRMDTYAEALETLKERDAVYPCFCTKEALDAKRAEAEETEGGYNGYDRTCRNLSKEEAQSRIEAGEPHVWRLKVPTEHGPIEFDDAVYGEMSFPLDVMDDMILVRTDGTPTYNFAVVCDDSNMGITHVIRGDDHLSNTPRQILIYEALGAEVPVFAHLSMILGPDNKKLSKRHGATSVEEYRDRGYLPDAMVNFLALLGWSMDGETTIIDRETLCKTFSLDRITKKDAVFDETKLNWMNGVYIREMGASNWVEEAKPWIARAMIQGRMIGEDLTILTAEEAETRELYQPTDSEIADASKVITSHHDYFEKMYPLVAERLERFDEIPAKLSFLFWDYNLELDDKSMRKVLLKENARADEVLRAVRNIFEDENNAWEAEALQNKCRDLCETMDIKPRNLFQPIRVAVCGNMVSPPLFESIELMERIDVIARIDLVLEKVFA